MDLNAVARAQYGVVTAAQALASGLTPASLVWRVESGRWLHVAGGLYAVAPVELDWWGRASALLLRCGPLGALSLESAAYVHGFSSRKPSVITASVPRTRHVRRLPGTRVSRRLRLPSQVVRRLSVTSPAVTVLDLAAMRGTSWRDAVGVAARAVHSGVVTPAELAEELSQRRRQAHRRALLLAAGQLEAGAESGLEVGFVTRVVVAHGLPRVRLQVPANVGGLRVRRDAEFEGFGVVVELDGELGHVADGVARDHRRDRKTASSGRVTVRLGYAETWAESCEIAVDLARILRQRGWAGRPLSCHPGCIAGSGLAA